MTALPDPAYAVIADTGAQLYAWGPFDLDTASRFAAFVTREIDPAKVAPWAQAQDGIGIKLRDPVLELLSWRDATAYWARGEHIPEGDPTCP